MITSAKRRLFIVLLTAMALVASGVFCFAASSNVSITGYNMPSVMKAGSSFKITGKLTSDVKIKRVEVGIAKSSSQWTRYKYDNKKVNSTTFDLSKARSKLKFNKLNKGSYYYRIYAHTSDGKVHVVLNQQFTVLATVKSTGAKVVSLKTPTTLTKGKSFKISGKVKSSKKIKKVTVGVVNAATGKWTSVKYTKKKINAKSFKLKKIASKLKFGKLAAGSYIFRVDVTTTGGTATIATNSFTVTAPVVTTTAQTGFEKSPANVVNPNEMKADTSSSKALTKGDIVSLSSVNKPVKYTVGKKFSVSGKIKSKETIERVEIGIVFEPTNKWTAYKFDKKKINAKTFDISEAASKLQFDKIPAGTYKYRIYVHTAKGIAIALNHTFTVKSSGKPQAAVDWAVKIANNNKFTYGKVPKTSTPGCYFCKTNQKKKPKGYERTYVCITFAGAAYAHGAEDPEILAQCKKGRMTMYENNCNFTKFSCWMKIGSCSELSINDLMPGDVIIKWDDNNAYGHACIYVGGDQLVEAAIPGWSAKSIAVNSGAARRLSSLSSSKKNYVMRYIH